MFSLPVDEMPKARNKNKQKDKKRRGGPRPPRPPPTPCVNHRSDNEGESSHHRQEVIKAHVASRQWSDTEDEGAPLIDPDHLVGQGLSFPGTIENLANVGRGAHRGVADRHQDIALAKAGLGGRAPRPPTPGGGLSPA